MSDYKDPNEWLRADGNGLKEALNKAEETVNKEEQESKQKVLDEYNKLSAGSKLNDFIKNVDNKRNTQAIATGYSALDYYLDGGLYEGLYFVGAISSLGKTTFCLQMADQIAKAGQDVLFFALEQSEYELMSKSLSRLTYEGNNEDISNSLTARQITNPIEYTNNNEYKKMVLQNAFDEYERMTKNKLFFFEGIGDISVEPNKELKNKSIKEAIEEHIKITGNKPVVIIDYLQILAPSDIKASDKQNIDRAVTALKRISRDYKLPIVCISSFNRNSYTADVNMSSFKESGAIEYSSDVLMAIQPFGIKKGSGSGDEKENKETIEKVKNREDRPLELVVLKNRNGRTGGRFKFTFFAKFNYCDNLIYQKPEEYEKEKATFKPTKTM